MKKPLATSDWERLWTLRRAGFCLDLLPHSGAQLELEACRGSDPVRIVSTDNFTWLQLSVVMRPRCWVSIVEASLLIDSPAREYHSIPQSRVPTEVQRFFRRPQSKTSRFTFGGSSVLHLPPRSRLPGCLLLGGELELPILLPGQTLPAELWLRDRGGCYYGTGFAWRGGIELSAGAGDEVCPGEKLVPPPVIIS
jgi:hypothetical protein